MYFSFPRNVSSRSTPRKSPVILASCLCGLMLISSISRSDCSTGDHCLQYFWRAVPRKNGPPSQKIVAKVVGAPAGPVPNSPGFFGAETAVYWACSACLLAIVGLAKVLSWLATFAKQVLPAYQLWQSSPRQATARTRTVFECGAGLKDYDEMDKAATVPRTELVSQLKKFIRPDMACSFGVLFHVSGCGKSTALRRAIREQDVAGGVIYFETPENPKYFVTELAAMLNFYGVPLEVEKILKDRTQSNPDAWALFAPTLKKSALEYKAKKTAECQVESASGKNIQQTNTPATSRPAAQRAPMAVLIIDSVETLAKKDPEFLEVLLLFAKACADKDTMRMLFVGSEGETLPILEGYSSYSRAVPFGSLFMDIPDSQAIIYLQHLIPPEEESQAKALVKDLTGGRFTLLNKVAHLVRNGTPYEQIRGDFLNAVSEKLTTSVYFPIFIVVLASTSIQTADNP